MLLKIPTSHLNKLFAAISAENTLYLPLEKNGLVEFGQWSPDSTVRLDTLNTIRSPKDFFFLPSEDIAAFKMQQQEISIKDAQIPNQPFVVFGMRVCDAESLNLLDKIFLSEPTDTFYQARRQNGIIITAACFKPAESCFCGVFDINALSPGGDIATILIGDTLYWQSLTERGQQLTAKLQSLLEQTNNEDEEAIKQQQTAAQNIFAKLPFNNLNLAGFIPEVLMEKFNSEQWAELYPGCLACGTCTFICPTCHCYDIQDFNTGSEIKRTRCWDSCMYADFTLMAHGNPRTNKLQRFRQRYMHKLIYFPDQNKGAYACVGCGRCVQKCPIGMNIVKVIKAWGVDSNV